MHTVPGGGEGAAGAAGGGGGGGRGVITVAQGFCKHKTQQSAEVNIYQSATSGGLL